jgi:hypothetical protein
MEVEAIGARSVVADALDKDALTAAIRESRAGGHHPTTHCVDARHELQEVR